MGRGNLGSARTRTNKTDLLFHFIESPPIIPRELIYPQLYHNREEAAYPVVHGRILRTLHDAAGSKDGSR